MFLKGPRHRNSCNEEREVRKDQSTGIHKDFIQILGLMMVE
jgi:hypothetical protein